MSSRPAAQLTSDLLARKGSAQPAAREEDLYRPRRPAAAVVELGGVQSAAAGARPEHGDFAGELPPEASLRQVPISRPASPAGDPPDRGETGRAQPAATLDALEEQPAAVDEAAALTEFAEYTEVATPAFSDGDTTPAAIEVPTDDATDAGIAAEVVEDDEPTTAAPEEAATDALAPALPDMADSEDDADVHPVVPPPPISRPVRVPRPLTPSVLADIASTADRGRDRRSLGSAVTVFGLSALVGVVLAIVWLAADNGLPDLQALWQSAAPSVDKAKDTETAPPPRQDNPASTAAPGAAAGAATEQDSAGSGGNPSTATPADVAAAAVAENAKTAASAAPAAPVPELDVVRIGEDGYPLLAGRAGPLARLIILDNDAPIGTAEADGNGEWVFQGNTRLNPGRHAFSVSVGNADAGAATAGSSAANAGATLTVPEPSAPAAKPEADATTEAEPADDTASARQSFESALGVYYVVQLGSLPAEADALRLWREIAQRYPKLVDGLEPVIQTAAQSGGGTIHRLRTGPFASLQKARQMCGDFKKVGQDCLVVKREKNDG